MEYFGNTLENVGLPEAWLECDSNCVTQIKNKYVRRESNRVKKIVSNQIETTIESNQIESHSSQASGSPTYSRVFSKNSNTEIVEYYTILIIEIGFGKNILTK